MSAVTRYPRPTAYWDFLTQVLFNVFQEQNADLLVGKIRQAIQAAPIEEQLFFFHKEPFDIAVNMTRKPINPTLLSDYLALVSKLNWKP